MWSSSDTPLPCGNIDIDPDYPALDVRLFCEQYSIPVELPRAIVKDALLRGAHHVITEIGHPPKEWTDILESFFARAVFCQTKVELLREAPTFFRLKVAENAAKFSEESEDCYLSLSCQAIRSLLGIAGNATITLL